MTDCVDKTGILPSHEVVWSSSMRKARFGQYFNMPVYNVKKSLNLVLIPTSQPTE